MTMPDMIKETTMPSNGAKTMNSAILPTPANITALMPAFANAAPARPPTRVWEELDGNPHHQVRRFQIMAAPSAAATTLRLIISGSTTPLPIVVATFNGK